MDVQQSQADRHCHCTYKSTQISQKQYKINNRTNWDPYYLDENNLPTLIFTADPRMMTI